MVDQRGSYRMSPLLYRLQKVVPPASIHKQLFPLPKHQYRCHVLVPVLISVHSCTTEPAKWTLQYLERSLIGFAVIECSILRELHDLKRIVAISKLSNGMVRWQGDI